MGHFRLRVGPVWTELVEGDPGTVDKLLTIPDPNAPTSAAFAAKLTDGLIHYFNVERSNAFLAGLTWRLTTRLEKRGHTVEVEHDPAQVAVAVPPAECLEGLVLRDHQMAGTEAALEHLRGLLWQATNAGKSAIIAALCYAFHAAGLSPGYILVPNIVILRGLTKDLRSRLPHLRIGMVGDEERQTKNADVVVATYQTFQAACPSGNRRADQVLARIIELARFALVDEAHHAGGAVYQKILKMSYNAVARLGFTGSADKKTKRTDAMSVEKSAPAALKHKWDVESVLGPVLFRTENQEMIAAGYSAQPRVFVVDDRRAYGPDVAPVIQKPPTADGKRKKQLNVYMETFRRAVINDATFLKTIARVVRTLLHAGKPPFVFSHSVEHLTALSRVLTERGIAHKVLHGVDSTERRENVIDLFSRRKDFALLTSSIFDEGANVPEIRAVVFAGGRKAVVELLQRIGRGIRAKKDDNTLTVVDFRPSHCRALVEHYEERRAVYRTEGFPVSRILDITRLSEVGL